jgi:hypothetical protein
MSEMITFPPNATTLASPADGAAGVSTTQILAWNAVSNATTYRLQVSTDESFSTTVFDDSTLSGTSEQVPGLANKTKYFWHVNAKNSAGTGPFSDVWSFTTVPAAPSSPKLVGPAYGAKNQPINPTLYWNGVDGATDYRLQVSTTPSFSTTVFDDSTLSGTSAQVPGLAHKTKYFWHVNAKNSAGTSPFSDVWSFTTVPAAPSSPTLVEPADGAKDQPINLTLEWNGVEDAAAYRLQVSKTPSFSTTVFDDSTLSGTSAQVPGLAHKTKYFWHVNAKNSAGTSPFSDVWSFTTVPAAPSSPTLVEPADGAKDQPINLTLEWNGVEDAAAYRLQVSTTPSFSTTVFDDSTLTTPSREVGPLQINTDYYWRAAAKNEAGMSPYSPIWGFTTGTTSVLERLDNSIPTEYMLEQNYPNPFNSSTTIRFSLPRAGHVTLKVFNMFGEELAVLASKELPAGTYTTNWDATSIASGIYFYRLQAGDYIATKKLISLK